MICDRSVSSGQMSLMVIAAIITLAAHIHECQITPRCCEPSVRPAAGPWGFSVVVGVVIVLFQIDQVAELGRSADLTDTTRMRSEGVSRSASIHHRDLHSSSSKRSTALASPLGRTSGSRVFHTRTPTYCRRFFPCRIRVVLFGPLAL